MKKIDTRSLVDRVYEYLLNQIITGGIKYGDTINLKKVAAELSISTMPVREAVKRLEFEQIVDVKPRSHCSVRRPTRRTVLEVYDLREALELYCVQRSLGRVPPETLQSLRTIVEDMRAVDGIQDTAAREAKAVELDRMFHRELCAMAGNEFLNGFYRQLSLHVNMTLIHERTYRKLESQYAEGHAEILRCLESDAPRALEVLQRHFRNVKELLLTNGWNQEEGE
jgi:DNA-binding GntR family transcriptional regulator